MSDAKLWIDGKEVEIEWFTLDPHPPNQYAAGFIEGFPSLDSGEHEIRIVVDGVEYEWLASQQNFDSKPGGITVSGSINHPT